MTRLSLERTIDTGSISYVVWILPGGPSPSKSEQGGRTAYIGPSLKQTERFLIEKTGSSRTLPNFRDRREGTVLTRGLSERDPRCCSLVVREGSTVL